MLSTKSTFFQGFWSLKSHELQTLQSVSQLFNIMIKCNKTRCRRQNHCFLNAFWRAEVGLKRETLITFSQFIPAAPCQNTPETRYCRQNHCYLHALAYRNQPETRSSHQILTCYHACTLPKQPWNTMMSTKTTCFHGCWWVKINLKREALVKFNNGSSILW